MESTQRQATLWAILACAFVAALLFARMSAFGIWDPWELSTADAARRIASGEVAPAADAFSTWLVGLGFRFFGVHEWAGRAPIALSGLLTAVVSYVLARRYAGARAGVYAALITGTTPLFVFNSRAMLGEAPGFAAQAAVLLAACSAVFPRAGGEISERARAAWLVFLVAVATLSTMISGALLGPLPPLAAVGVTIALHGRRVRSTSVFARVTAMLMPAAAFALLLLVVHAIRADDTGYSVWLGGRAGSSTPPTFDAVIEEVFHAFAPWSAILPLAIGSAWLRATGPGSRGQHAFDEHNVALSSVLLLNAAFGYAAQTIYFSRYGREVAFLPVVALATLVALFLRDIESRDDERQGEPQWGAGIAALFLTGLLIRDYAMYPNGPVSGMPLATFDVPKIFDSKKYWAALFGAFGVFALLGLGAGRPSEWPSLLAPYRLVREQWNRGLAFKLWLITFALIALGLCTVGVLAMAIPDKLHLTTLAAKWLRRVAFVVPAVPVAIALGQLVPFVFGKLGNFRLLPLMAAGCAIGAYAAQGYLPALSEHFSPREVYESYNRLAKDGEALGEFRVGGRAAAYYARGKVVELASASAVIDHLAGDSQRWVAFPADELANLDRMYRKRTGEHLVVADARSARVVLVTNRSLGGHAEPSYLERAVRKEPPAKIQFPVVANFDDRIELLGYDLALPHDGYVGAGESFKLTWYFKTLRAVPGDYRVFVHVDGEGQRIHGDHETVDGKYPVRLWEEGDVIADQQTIDIPSSYRGGEYALFMGFFSGEARLTLKSGPNDGTGRARVGVLRIR